MGMKKRTKVSAEFSMSSLTDIIFLLLIFFMLTSSMVVPNGLNLRLPGQATAKNPNQPKYPPLQVEINKNGTYTLDGSSASLSGIEKKVRERKRQTDKVSVVIMPRKGVSNIPVIAIYDMAYRYKIDAVTADPK